MSTEEKKLKADYIRKPLQIFDHQMHQKLATYVTGVSFDAQWHEVFAYVYRSSVGYESTELRVWIEAQRKTA